MIELARKGEYWWPAGDIHCRDAVNNELAHVGTVVEACEQHRVAVQAGANVGLFPKALAEHFDRVICFEPYIANALAAGRNLQGIDNVEMWLAALGEKQGRTGVAMFGGDDNCGAIETRPGGMLPVLTIDGLNLTDCDLIWLDIEGDEPLALCGAAETIKRCRPVIVIEDKGLCRRHDIEPERVFTMLKAQGYAKAGNFGNDVLFKPRKAA